MVNGLVKTWKKQLRQLEMVSFLCAMPSCLRRAKDNSETTFSRKKQVCRWSHEALWTPCRSHSRDGRRASRARR